MKYKVLLVGNNGTAIKDFFHQLEDAFEMVSSSNHFVDLDNHIKFFKPDAIVYCVDNSIRKIMSSMVSLQQKSYVANIPVMVLGTSEECDECMRIGPSVIAHVIVKPINATGIRHSIGDYLDKLRRAEAKELSRVKIDKAEHVKAYGEDAVVMETSDKQHILLVDDDVTMLKTMKSFLDEEYKVSTAVSGTVALRFLEKRKVDLIFLDYEMPGMNGPELLIKLREDEELGRIPVVFLTGASERQKIATAISMKPQGYILKPVSKEKLLENAHSILDIV